MRQAVLLLAMGMAITARAQSQPHVIRVNPDGSFTPQTTYIRSGDTVRWEGLVRTDSIIPASSGLQYPAVCSAVSPYSSAPNDLTAPISFAPGGVYTLGPFGAGYTETNGTCPAGTATQFTAGGRRLCLNGAASVSLDSTWASPETSGVFIRLLWNQVEPQKDAYDFTALEREINQAVRYGKMYSITIKAGDEGTPDWIFSTNANDTLRAVGGGIPRLHFRDKGDDGSANASCGKPMDLGNPTRALYRQYYQDMLKAVAAFIKRRADWYRALGYVKLSGANLFSAENRLPNSCDLVGTTQCTCNTQLFSADGYRPSGLYTFYDEQEALVNEFFPGKAMGYALIQSGFPRISESGGYLTYNGSSSDGTSLPGAFEQTQTNLDRGQARQGNKFVPEHLGIGPKPLARCNFDGLHPKPVLQNLDDYWDVGSGCPNRWAVREGAEGQITGFQTNNLGGVSNASQLESSLQNMFDNTDGIFLEIYEELFWQIANSSSPRLPSGKRIADWDASLVARRKESAFPQYASLTNPFPSTVSKTLTNSTPGVAQTLTFIHGMKCGRGNQEWGQIVIDAQPASLFTGGVVNGASFAPGSAVSAGSIASAFGSQLASALNAASVVPLPTTLGGVSVQINNTPAPLFLTSAGQINLQVPWELVGQTQASVVATVGSTPLPAITMTLAPTAPGIFTTNSQGSGQGAILISSSGEIAAATGSVGSARARPVNRGEFITIYATGLGPVTNRPASGAVSPSGLLAEVTSPIAVTFGAITANPSFAGLAPGFVGLYQVNVAVPADAPTGGAIALTVRAAGEASNIVTLAIR